MAAQAELFPNPATTLTVGAGLGEPRLWVRRLMVWAKPGEIIRDIRLRRGLNIVWSPDPGPSMAELGRNAGSGHGAGKTLFCRLLRYCLGEETFANDDLRRKIAAAFPEGLVGVEVLICGEPWAVLRPFVPTRKHTVREGAVLEDLVESTEPGTGMQPLLRTLTARLLSPGIEDNMPGHREWKSWLFALAWAARDQECRFRHILEWRDPGADSRSPAVGPTKEQLAVVVRSLLDVIESDEIAVKNARDRIAERKHGVEREISYLQQRTEQLRIELATSLSLTPEAIGTGDLAATALHESALARLGSLERESDSTDPRANLTPLREKLEVVLRERAIIEEQVRRTEGLLAVHQEQIKALRGERANLDAAEIKARLGAVCPVCNVPIDRALAEGCGLSHVVPDPTRVADQKGLVAVQIQSCNEAISMCQQQNSQRDKILRGLREQEAEVRGGVSAIEMRENEIERERRQRWFLARSLVEKALELRQMHNDTAEAQRNLQELAREDERLGNRQQVLRSRHRDILSRLNELFSYVCRGVLGDSVKSSLTLTGQGFHADVQVGGMAMESLKAIAFDLAAMLMSIEGRAGVPAFFLHDSPREADLGESIYHRLFRLMSSLEQISADPPFQYIITTTTEPPEELRSLPQLVLRLHGSEVDDRLLRRDLH